MRRYKRRAAFLQPSLSPIIVSVNKGEEAMAKYRCTVCGYIYDPAVGDQTAGIKPGTSFESLPAEWVCPECGVGKDMFEKI